MNHDFRGHKECFNRVKNSKFLIAESCVTFLLNIQYNCFMHIEILKTVNLLQKDRAFFKIVAFLLNMQHKCFIHIGILKIVNVLKMKHCFFFF